MPLKGAATRSVIAGIRTSRIVGGAQNLSHTQMLWRICRVRRSIPGASWMGESKRPDSPDRRLIVTGRVARALGKALVWRWIKAARWNAVREENPLADPRASLVRQFPRAPPEARGSPAADVQHLPPCPAQRRGSVAQ